MLINNSTFMNWAEFKTHLQQHPEQLLQFLITDDIRVSPSYHITEIKQAPVISVDCGGVMNSWTEIIIQLWEPEQAQSERAMTVAKALSIVDLVERQLPLNPNGIVKIEFGNTAFDTRLMYPSAMTIEGEDLIVTLSQSFTECKALSRGSSCGIAQNKTTNNSTPGSLNSGTASDNTSACTPGAACC